jgi:hypothetical protein
VTIKSISKIFELGEWKGEVKNDNRYYCSINICSCSSSYDSKKEPYGISYGCTISKDIDGLMMSGRCISVDAVSFGSTRVMPTCMAVGVGIAAALAVKHGVSPRNVDVKELREKLIHYGAILSL